MFAFTLTNLQQSFIQHVKAKYAKIQVKLSPIIYTVLTAKQRYYKHLHLRNYFVTSSDGTIYHIVSNIAILVPYRIVSISR